MPYGDSLRSLGWWYAQLLGESLGKALTVSGEKIHYGRIPVAAVGTTDMHSLTQEHQEGKRNKLVQFITVRESRKDADILCDEGKERGPVPLSYMLSAAQRSDEEALAHDGRMSCDLIMRRCDAFPCGGAHVFSLPHDRLRGGACGRQCL